MKRHWLPISALCTANCCICLKCRLKNVSDGIFNEKRGNQMIKSIKLAMCILFSMTMLESAWANQSLVLSHNLILFACQTKTGEKINLKSLRQADRYILSFHAGKYAPLLWQIQPILLTRTIQKCSVLSRESIFMRWPNFMMVMPV